MALITCDFFSETLSVSTSVSVILPEQASGQIGMKGKTKGSEPPVLYLLHGFSDDQTTWMRRTSIERYAAEYGLAVVMPDVGHSYYADMVYGNNYWTFLTEELPAVVHHFFRLSNKREDTFVAGLSMGGYGAFKWALSAPDQFAAAASLSGVVDIACRAEAAKGEETPMARALYYAFGDNRIKDSENDLLHLLRKRNGHVPSLYLACGKEDFLFKENKTFIEACEELQVPLVTDIGPGNHEWSYWDTQIKHVLKWLPIKK